MLKKVKKKRKISFTWKTSQSLLGKLSLKAKMQMLLISIKWNFEKGLTNKTLFFLTLLIRLTYILLLQKNNARYWEIIGFHFKIFFKCIFCVSEITVNKYIFFLTYTSKNRVLYNYCTIKMWINKMGDSPKSVIFILVMRKKKNHIRTF